MEGGRFQRDWAGKRFGDQNARITLWKMREHNPDQFIGGTGPVSRINHHHRLNPRRQRAKKRRKQNPGPIQSRKKNPFHAVMLRPCIQKACARG